jgi:glycosyltransferase involved in cell wall biosynthesis
MNDPLISVLIPVYNVELFVADAVNCIINQTYKNIEVIVVDDGSTDATFDKVQELARVDARVRVFKNDTNSKIVETLNRAFALSNGEFIARMDGDDLCDLDRIERKLRFLQDHPEYDLVGCSLKAIDSNGLNIGSFVHYAREDLLFRTMKYVSPVSHVWLARRSVYERLGGYRNIPCVEDYDFLLRMKSEGLRFTNLQNYFGYSVRLGRDGNTAASYGIIQRKMQSYAYRLYKTGRTSFYDVSSEEIARISDVSIRIKSLHLKSTQYLMEAIKSKGNSHYGRMVFYSLISCISPYQVKYLFDRILYRSILKFEEINLGIFGGDK